MHGKRPIIQIFKAEDGDGKFFICHVAEDVFERSQALAHAILNNACGSDSVGYQWFNAKLEEFYVLERNAKKKALQELEEFVGKEKLERIASGQNCSDPRWVENK